MTIAEAVAPPPTPQARQEPDHVVPTPEVQLVAKRRWVFPVVITAAAVAVYAIVFAVLLERTGGEDEPDPPVASPSTLAADPTPTTPPDPASSVTAPPPPTELPTTTAVPTTTASTEPPVPPIPALVDPIPLEDLTLGAFSLGPLQFGSVEENALGRLVATFGQPDDVFAIGEADGLCPTESGRAARFGWLTVLVRDEAGTEVLVGYQLEEPSAGSSGHATADLRTISGAAIGDTLADWNSIYATSIVRTAEVDNVTILLLVRSSDERTLLWGPLSADDPPMMVGIYSPRPCDGGPFG